MSEAATKPVLLELPIDLARQAKVDAARRDITLKQWWREAAELKLGKGTLAEAG
jgi:hypothetical protein